MTTRGAAKSLAPVLLVALGSVYGSVSLALAIAGQLAQPLGDDPLRLLLACGVFAGLAGVLQGAEGSSSVGVHRDWAARAVRRTGAANAGWLHQRRSIGPGWQADLADPGHKT